MIINIAGGRKLSGVRFFFWYIWKEIVPGQHEKIFRSFLFLMEKITVIINNLIERYGGIVILIRFMTAAGSRGWCQVWGWMCSNRLFWKVIRFSSN